MKQKNKISVSHTIASLLNKVPISAPHSNGDNKQTEKRKEKTDITPKQAQTILTTATIGTIITYTLTYLNPFLIFAGITISLILIHTSLNNSKETQKMKCAHKLNYGKECHPTNCPVFTLKASDSLRKRCSQIREETWQPKSSVESQKSKGK